MACQSLSHTRIVMLFDIEGQHGVVLRSARGRHRVQNGLTVPRPEIDSSFFEPKDFDELFLRREPS